MDIDVSKEPCCYCHLEIMANDEQTYIRKSIREPTKEEVVHSVRKRHYLTDREEEVLFYLCNGYDTQLLMSKLVIAKDTTKEHIQKIYDKTHVNKKRKLIKLVEDEERKLYEERINSQNFKALPCIECCNNILNSVQLKQRTDMVLPFPPCALPEFIYHAPTVIESSKNSSGTTAVYLASRAATEQEWNIFVVFLDN